MTSEKELRQIARDEVRRIVHIPNPYHPIWEDYPYLKEDEWNRVHHLICTWPIPEMPPADRDGCWWPNRGINYGHVRRETVKPNLGFPFTRIVIARGGLGESSKHASLHLTPAEAEELASLLLAAAHYERNQE